MNELPFLEKDLNPTPLVTALIQKTKEGKVKWEPTAEENTFIATLGGGTTLRIYLTSTEDYNEYGRLESVEFPQLRLLDEKGRLLWEFPPGEVQGGLWPLFKLAQRIGNKLDERMTNLMEALQKL